MPDKAAIAVNEAGRNDGMSSGLATVRRRRPRRNENGFTLLETLAALMMVGMVASILYGFMLMGVSTYKRVETETKIRHQGDLLMAGLVSELLEAVHVEQGTDRTELIAVRMASDPSRYVETYRLCIETLDGRHGVSVYRDGETDPVRRYELAPDIALEAPGTHSVLQADGNRAAIIRMQFVQASSPGVKAQETPLFIETRVSVSRLE
jgi:prepilin-type N-terminal cleavage/methylation domain-containing protein